MQSSFRTENFQLGIVYYCNLAVSDDLLFINKTKTPSAYFRGRRLVSNQ